MPTFIADYNDRFAKSPRGSHDAHRPIRSDESLDLIFAWRELRKVTHSLTLNFERKLYLLANVPAHRRLAGKYIDVFQYPDGKIELRAAGVVLPYTTYDRLGVIDQGEIVANKRLGHVLHVLHVAQLVQANRDSRNVAGPSTAHRHNGKHVPRTKAPGASTQRQLNSNHLQRAIEGAKVRSD
jgi:hypothetical protein